MAEAYLPKKFDAGIRINSMLGLVSEFESREAAVYSHYTPEAWPYLDWRERALAVAQYRCHFLVEAHVNAAAAKAADR